MAVHRSQNKKSDLGSGTARVIAANRRFITLRTDAGEELSAKSSTKTLEVIVGDNVSYSARAKDFVVDAVLPRRNTLKRQYLAQLKELASNLDLICVVSAVKPQLNTDFIDRITLAAYCEGIECALIFNKIDLGEAESSAAVYEALDMPLLRTSALTGGGLPELRSILSNPALSTVAFAGVSGVGKTSLLNLLMPEAGLRTGDVSKRTGQGRQTTTLAMAHLYRRSPASPLNIIDLPGFSSFGVSYLSSTAAREGFPEFARYRENCQYADCFHLQEPDCAVKSAVDNGRISPSRYASYLDILQEIEAARPY